MSGFRSFLRSHDTLIALAILLLGAVERIVWLALRGLGSGSGEAENTAIAFATQGALANPFGRGSGLSAHINPVMPIFAGTVYRLFGVRSVPAEAILAGSSILVALAGAFMIYRTFRLLGRPVESGLLALALFAWLPLNLELEAKALRVWESGLAVLLGASVLYLAAATDLRVRVGWRNWALLSLLAALTIFISPAMGVATAGILGLLLLRTVRPAQWPAHAAVSALILAAVLAPWTIRNYEAFGRFIPIRSNAGLELAIGNHPAAVHPRDEAAVFLARLDEIHPYQSQRAFEKMRAAGDERIYADQMGAEANAWILANPGDFAALCVKHLGEFFFPPAWLWRVYENSSQGVLAKQVLIWTLAALGLAGAFCAAVVWGARFRYVAIFALAPALPYIVVQPILRYRYLVFATLLFLAVEFVRWLAALALGRGVAQVKQAPHLAPSPHHGIEDQAGEPA